MAKIKNVVFDLGGVLIEWDPRYLYRKLLPDEKAVDHFLREVCSPEWNVRQDAGRTIAEAEDELIHRFPQEETLIRAYYGRWEEMLGGSIEETVEILSELKDKSVPVYALSNWSAETYPTAVGLYPFLKWFDGEVISGQVKMIKPDAEIYLHLLNSFNLQAEETVFIDDRQDNIEAAEKLGIKGIRFTSPGQLKEELRNLEIF